MKRLFALILAAAMLFCLAACGGKQNSSETEPSTEASTEFVPVSISDVSEGSIQSSETEKAAVPVESELPLAENVTTLTYWIPMPPAESKGVRPDSVSFNDYMLEQTNVTFDFVGPAANAAADNFSILIAGGDYPDFIEKFGTYFSAGYESAIEQEIIMDVSDLIDAYMPHYNEAMNATSDRILAVTTDSGAVPGFTSFYENPSDDENVNTGYGAIIRQDYLDEQGLDVPETYEEYYAVLKVFQSSYDATMWLPYTGVAMDNAFIGGYNVAGYSNGSTVPFYVNDDGEVLFGPTQDGYYDYVSMMAQWYSEGLIYQDFVSGTDVMNADSNLYSSGSVGLFFCSNRAYSSLLTSYPDLNFAPSVNPVQEEGDIVHIGTVSSVNNISVVMTTQCQNPELAAKLIDWMYTDDASFHARYGFENEAYTLDENGDPIFTDLVLSSPEGREPTEALAALSINYFVWSSDPNIELELQGETYQNLYAIWGKQDGNDWNYPAAATLTEDESNDFSSAYSDIETYVREQTLRWICGEIELNEETFDAYKTAIEEMNISICIDAKQAAYDRYSARGV